MSRRSHLVLSVLLFALSLGVGWLVRTVMIDEPPAGESKPLTDRDGSSGTARTETATALAAPNEHSNSNEPSSARTKATPSVSIAAANTAVSAAELADAQWVQGTVRIPPDTPADDHAEVIADGREFASRTLYRAPIAPDGSFRVAFSKATKRGKLRVEGRYLYLPEPFALKLAEVPNDILLEPVVGGCIRGRFVLPPNALALSSAVRGTIVLVGRCKSNEGGQVLGLDGAAKTDDHLEFEIDHLATTPCWALRARPVGFVAAERDDIHLKPGAIEQLEFELRLGVRIAGRVEDENGAPVEGARFAAQRKGTDRENHHETSQVRSAADGAFDCAGLEPGDIMLTASKEGWLSATFQAGKMIDGAVRSETLFVLRTGNTVAGRVQWPDGKPVISGRVDLHPDRAASNGFEPIDPNRRVQTAEDGSFKITGLEKGTFSIIARAVPDSNPKSEDSTPAPASDSPEKKKRKGLNAEWSAHVDQVEAGQTGLVLVLQPAKAVQGRVVDDTGHPIESFSLQLQSVNDTDRETPLNESMTRSCHDADGVFRLNDLHDGRWRVNAVAKGFALGRPRTFKLPADNRLPDIVLMRGASISGLVVDAAGNPMPKAELRIETSWDGAGVYSRSNAGEGPSTDGEGRFEWKDVAPGGFRLLASAKGWADSAALTLDLLPGQTLSGLTLTLRAGGRLTGEVFDSAGKPDANRPLFMSAYGASGTSRHFAADSLGRIDVEHLVPGSYDIQTMQSAKESEESEKGGGSQHTSSTRQARVTIVDGETTHVSIGAPPQSPVRVHGVVTSGHNPVAGMRMSVHGRLSGGENVHHSTVSDAQGRYEIVLDEPGDWSFFLTLPSGTSSGRHVDIPKVSSFELDLSLPSGTISGRVVDPSGQPVAGIGVRLSTDPGTAELSSVAAGGSAFSDASGRFRFDSLPAGTYSLATTGTPRSSEGDAPLYGRMHKDGLVLEEGATLADIELRLTKAGRLDGVVLGLEGAPVPYALVFVRDDSGRAIQPNSPRQTGANGRFEYAGLSPGRYTVFARTPSLCSSESSPVTVRSDDSAEVELTLQPSAMLRVVVEDEQCQKIGAMISVVDGRGRDFGPMNPASEDDMGAEGLSLGRKFGPLPPGSYAVRATNHDKTSVGMQAPLSAGEQKVVTLRSGS